MAVPILETSAITNETGNFESTLVTEPSGLVDNDIILIWVSLDGSVSGINSSGFDLVFETNNGTSNTLGLLIKRASSESGAYTVNWTGSQQGRFMSQRISGCRSTGTQLDVIDITGTANTGTATTASPTRITSTEIDTLCLSAVGVDRDRVDAADVPSGTGWTEVDISGSSGGANGAGLICAENDMPLIEQVEALTFGTWASDDFVSNMINLKAPLSTKIVTWYDGDTD